MRRPPTRALDEGEFEEGTDTSSTSAPHLGQGGQEEGEEEGEEDKEEDEEGADEPIPISNSLKHFISFFGIYDFYLSWIWIWIWISISIFLYDDLLIVVQQVQVQVQVQELLVGALGQVSETR